MFPPAQLVASHRYPSGSAEGSAEAIGKAIVSGRRMSARVAAARAKDATCRGSVRGFALRRGIISVKSNQTGAEGGGSKKEKKRKEKKASSTRARV